MNPPLVLSVFPGIGLLDAAFEAEGFCVVRGPDILWGGDVRSFRPPREVFAGVIGGPPCQAHSTYSRINRAKGNRIAPDLVPEFARVVRESAPSWFLMENAPAVELVDVPGYAVARRELDARWLGMEQRRKRAFHFGRHGADVPAFDLVDFALEAGDVEPTCLAREGRGGRITNVAGPNGTRVSKYNPRRDWSKFCELQGLPSDFLDDSPFKQNEKYKVVGNGVPIPLGRAVARAIKHEMNKKQ